MGINTFSFDGVSSDTYGVYITEGASYNAPERAVEMLEIPGRNGHFALDQGRFENVEVTYHVFIDGSSETDYSANLSDLRNWLCSKVGYARLTDSYNPNEFRMAVYKSGLEVDGTSIQSGEFDVVFDCKPQRWLTSGETAVSVADGGTIDNPTLFESEPLITYDGYGTIEFNGYTIETDNVYLGDIVLAEGKDVYVDTSYTLDESSLNVGDSITIDASEKGLTIPFRVSQPRGLPTVSSATITDTNAICTTVFSSQGKLGDTARKITYRTTFEPFDIVVGTSSSVTNTVNMTVHIAATTSYSAYSFTVQASQTIAYNASTHKITVSQTKTYGGSYPSGVSILDAGNGTMTYKSIVGHSTIPIATDTKHIDCEIGEVYTIKNGGIVPMNDIVALGSDLPKLVSGTNTFNYDNTITDFTVTPRWWKV